MQVQCMAGLNSRRSASPCACLFADEGSVADDSFYIVLWWHGLSRLHRGGIFELELLRWGCQGCVYLLLGVAEWRCFCLLAWNQKLLNGRKRRYLRYAWCAGLTKHCEYLCFLRSMDLLQVLVAAAERREYFSIFTILRLQVTFLGTLGELECFKLSPLPRTPQLQCLSQHQPRPWKDEVTEMV